MIASHFQTKAKIYLSGKRGITQADGFCGFHTFNFEGYAAPGKEPFLALHALNDEVLESGAVKIHQAKADSVVLLLPVVGGVKFKMEGNESRYMEVDTCRLLFIPKDGVLELSNPYRQERINYITAWFSITGEMDHREQFSLFNLKSRKNILTGIFTSSNASGFLGKFSGRNDHTFQLKESSCGAFVFVLEGVFEVEKRLLEHRDGLALWNIKSVEFEALSDDALILIFEL